LRILIIFFLSISPVIGQNHIVVSGYISDKKTGETLIGANVYSEITKEGTVSNNYGYFNLSLPKGENTIICSYIGYQSDTLVIKGNYNLNHNFILNPNSTILNNIVLEGDENNVKSVQSSVINLSAKQIKKIPALLGEKDVLKSIQLLPGVQSGSEGSSGFYVRGGGPDQNLLLLDGVNIYHASHLLGFFSVFNDDAIKNIKLTKGGFPARYGGRLSSVLEINMKDGNMKEWKVEGGIGVISGKLTIQGPIKKDKTSILVSARRTWLDLFKKPIVNALENKIDFNGEGNYYFYDLNTKINHKFSEKNRLFISLYSGKDVFFGEISDNSTDYIAKEFNEQQFQSNTQFGLSWSNLTMAIKWNHIFNDKIFINTSFIYGKYKFDNIIRTNNETINQYPDETISLIEESDYLYRSGIEDLGIKFNIDYNVNKKHNLKFGGSYVKHNFFPGFMDFYADYENYQVDTLIIFSEILKPDEAYLYLEDLFQINERLSTNIGLHHGIFHVNQTLYHSTQPRLSARYLINSNQSFKISYANMQQNIHLLANSSFGLPNDMWVPSTDVVKPQKSQQFVIGYNNNFEIQLVKKHLFESSIELYYKKMSDLITFSEGSNILFSNYSSWEERIEMNGTGVSRGLEFYVNKKSGKLTGWIGYTLSKSTRQFDNINLGNEYNYKFDRRHDLSIVSSYNLKKGIDLSATFVYGTGNAITMPIAQYLVSGSLLEGDENFSQYFDYGEKNSFRMRPYHRLDIGCNFHKNTNWGERTWTISIYNVYNRKNPFFIYLQEERVNGIRQREARQVSLFPIIPSIRYSFKF
tara:strand:+ start:66 stop:2489 length:2424 start_codon:yes stop_codon:yes gene_type:complete